MRNPLNSFEPLDPASPPVRLTAGAEFWDRGPARLAEWLVYECGPIRATALAREMVARGYAKKESVANAQNKLARLAKAGRILYMEGAGYYHPDSPMA